jgi:hypothetical protein
MLRDDERIATLCQELELDLDCYNFQFLWLLPIVEVMWADGRCQKEEVEILLHYVDRFAELVRRDVPEITPERARRFFLPLLETEAINDPHKRAGLSRLVDQIIRDVVALALQDKRLHLFSICLDVAAAAQDGEQGPDQRSVTTAEKQLLRDLFRELRLGED